MAGIGFVLICEDVAYDDENRIFYAKNPYDTIILDKLPEKNFPFHILLSLYSLINEKTYPLAFTFYGSDNSILSEIEFPFKFISNPPEGKKETGVITLNIQSKNLTFKDEGLHRIKVKLIDPDENREVTKYIDFPVFLKTRKEERDNE